MNPLSLITSAASTIFGGIKDIILGHVQNDADKINASLEIGKLQLQFQETLVQAGEQFVAAQSANIQADAAGKDWLQRDWRAVLMLFFGGCIGWIILGGGNNIHGQPIPQDYVNWVLKIVFSGVTGYVGAPVATAIVKAFGRSNGSNGNGNGTDN